jgi:predicted Zn-dependent protease
MLLSSGFCELAIATNCVLLALSGGAQQPPKNEFRELLQQGFALHQQAKFVEAIPMLEKARRMEPDDYFANLLLGIDLLRTDKTAEAIGFLQIAARANPDEDTPEEYLGEAQARLGHFAHAAAAYMEGVKRGKSSEESVLAWAGFALERFRQIGEQLRSSEEGVAAMRMLQDQAKQPVASLRCSAPIPVLEKRLEARNANSDAATNTRHDLSLCYAVEADGAAAQLNGHTQDQAALHQLRGDVLLRLSNDASGAQSEYKQAIAVRGQDPALYERMAEAQMSAGDPEEARQSAMAALGIDPHRRAAMGTLATLAMNNRDYEEALPWLEKMKAESPKDRKVEVELGKALAQTGKPAEALTNLQDALAVGYPDEKGALHSLEARLLRELGRNAEAAKAAEEAKRLSNAFQSRNRSGSRNRSESGNQRGSRKKPDAEQ